MSSTVGRAARVFLPAAAVFALLGGALVASGLPPAYTLAALFVLTLAVGAGVGHTPYSRLAVGRRGRVTEDEVVRHVACDECGADAVWGVRREYRRELVLFGTPFWTLARGGNVYCRVCSDDPSLRTVEESSERGVAGDVETERS